MNLDFAAVPSYLNLNYLSDFNAPNYTGLVEAWLAAYITTRQSPVVSARAVSDEGDQSLIVTLSYDLAAQTAS